MKKKKGILIGLLLTATSACGINPEDRGSCEEHQPCARLSVVEQVGRSGNLEYESHEVGSPNSCFGRFDIGKVTLPHLVTAQFQVPKGCTVQETVGRDIKLSFTPSDEGGKKVGKTTVRWSDFVNGYYFQEVKLE